MATEHKFDASLAIGDIDEEVIELQKRRLSTYSVEALKVACQVDKVFVHHHDFRNALKMLDRLFQLGTELSMPQGARLIGSTGVGKTAVFRYFQLTLPSSSLFSPGLGAVGIRLPKAPKTGHIVQGLLSAIRYPFATGSAKQLYQRRALVFEALRSMGTRLIWLDEAQHLIRPGRANSEDWENESTEFLRELMDECRVSLVLAGTSALDNLPAAASHLASRVTSREEIKDFELDGVWVGFVRAFSKQCDPLDMAICNESGTAKKLHMATDGNLRAFKRLITESVLLMVDQRETCLTIPVLRQAFGIVYGRATTRSNPFD